MLIYPILNRYKTEIFSEISQNPLESVAQNHKKNVARTSDTSLFSFRNVESRLSPMMPKTPRSIESLRIRAEWTETQDE